MHLAIVCERLTQHDDAADQARELAEHFADLGHRVTVLAAVGIDHRPREGVEVRLFNRRWWRFAFGLVVFRRWLISNLAAIGPDYTLALTTLLPADAVAPSAGTAAGYAAVLRTIRGPLLVRVRAWMRSLYPAQWLRQWWERQSIAGPRAKALIADNSVIDLELRAIKGVDVTRIHRIGPSLCASRLNDESALHLRRQLARALDLDEDAAWLVFPFRSAWLEGFEPMMLAFKALVERGIDATLLLAGPARYTHLAWIAQLGLRERVRLLGRPDHPEQLLAAADLLVQPTQHDPGGAWPLAALAVGQPTLTTDAGGAAEWIGPGLGTVLAAPVDPALLTEALAKAVESATNARQGGFKPTTPPSTLLDPGERARAVLALLGAPHAANAGRPAAPV
ncbi:MAG: glycosyltransferase family 4 protein [Phycisphaeraceae bacterium]